MIVKGLTSTVTKRFLLKQIFNLLDMDRYEEASIFLRGAFFANGFNEKEFHLLCRYIGYRDNVNFKKSLGRKPRTIPEYVHYSNNL